MQRASLHAAGALLLLSGVLWLAAHYWASPLDERAAALQAWSLRVHGAGAMAFLVVLGTLLPTHVQRGWEDRVNIGPGFAMLAAALALAVTGWGLYYAGSDALRAGLSLAHWLAGLAAVPLLALHIGRGRQSALRKGWGRR